MMNHQSPPSIDDNDAYIFVDHREEDLSIVEAVAAVLEGQYAIEAHEETEEFSIVFNGSRYVVPLDYSPHDRYITISSLAYLLGEHYQFFVLRPSLDSDTHGLLVVPVSAIRAWAAIPDHLIPLELGHDYFHGIQVPYLGGEHLAPEFAKDRQRIRNESNAMAAVFEAAMAGKMSDEVANNLASIVAVNSRVNEATMSVSEAEIAARIQAAFKEEMVSPEMLDIRRERDEAFANLRALINRPSKPWWKFW